MIHSNQLPSVYKTDEKTVPNMTSNIAKRSDYIKLVIYYKNMRLQNLIIINNQNQNLLWNSYVSYKPYLSRKRLKLLANIKCVGGITTTLSLHVTMRFQQGAPRLHKK